MQEVSLQPLPGGGVSGKIPAPLLCSCHGHRVSAAVSGDFGLHLWQLGTLSTLCLLKKLHKTPVFEHHFSTFLLFLMMLFEGDAGGDPVSWQLLRCLNCFGECSGVGFLTLFTATSSGRSVCSAKVKTMTWTVLRISGSAIPSMRCGISWWMRMKNSTERMEWLQWGPGTTGSCPYSRRAVEISHSHRFPEMGIPQKLDGL